MRIPCTIFGSLSMENLLRRRRQESSFLTKAQDPLEGGFTSGFERLAPEGAKTTYCRSPIKPTVGRIDDLPWVA